MGARAPLGEAPRKPHPRRGPARGGRAGRDDHRPGARAARPGLPRLALDAQQRGHTAHSTQCARQLRQCWMECQASLPHGSGQQDWQGFMTLRGYTGCLAPCMLGDARFGKLRVAWRRLKGVVWRAGSRVCDEERRLLVAGGRPGVGGCHPEQDRVIRQSPYHLIISCLPGTV